MADGLRIVGLGGSMRPTSSSLAALEVALEATAQQGASTELLAVGELDLPFYTPGGEPPAAAVELAGAVASADAMIWSSPLYHGSVSGSFKNAVDWLQLLADADPPYLTDKVVGLVATAGGVQGLQAVNAMEFMVRALRGWAVPMVLPIATSWQSFEDGELTDDTVRDQLQRLGGEVARSARQMAAVGTCDYADGRRTTQ